MGMSVPPPSPPPLPPLICFLPLSRVISPLRTRHEVYPDRIFWKAKFQASNISWPFHWLKMFSLHICIVHFVRCYATCDMHIMLLSPIFNKKLQTNPKIESSKFGRGSRWPPNADSDLRHKGLFINDVINFGGYRDPPLPLG